MTTQPSELEERQALLGRLRTLGSRFAEDCQNSDLVNLRKIVSSVQEQADLYRELGLEDMAAGR